MNILSLSLKLDNLETNLQILKMIHFLIGRNILEKHIDKGSAERSVRSGS